jgi:hypothetical protein
MSRAHIVSLVRRLKSRKPFDVACGRNRVSQFQSESSGPKVRAIICRKRSGPLVEAAPENAQLPRRKLSRRKSCLTCLSAALVAFVEAHYEAVAKKNALCGVGQLSIAVPAAAIASSATWSFEIPAEGPHGLDFDPATGRLFCACDAGVLVAVDADSGRVLGKVPLSGTPDVIFLHHQSRRLYVAVGDPGVIDVIDVGEMRRLEVVSTEAGAHTLALDRKRAKVYAFLPQSHRAAVFVDAA